MDKTDATVVFGSNTRIFDYPIFSRACLEAATMLVAFSGETATIYLKFDNSNDGLVAKFSHGQKELVELRSPREGLFACSVKLIGKVFPKADGFVIYDGDNPFEKIKPFLEFDLKDSGVPEQAEVSA